MGGRSLEKEQMPHVMGKGWLHVLLYSGKKRLLGHQNRMDEPRKKRGRRKEWHWDFKTSTWGKHLAAIIQLTGRKWQIWLLTWRTVWSYLWSHLDEDFIFNPVPSNCIVPAKSGDVPLRKTQKQPKFSHPQHLSFRISVTAKKCCWHSNKKTSSLPATLLPSLLEVGKNKHV